MDLSYDASAQLASGGLVFQASSEAAGLVEAETFLTTVQFGFRNLRVTVADTSAIWAAAGLQRH